MKIALLVPGGVDRSGRVRVIPVLLALIERLARSHQVVVITFHQEPEPCEYSLLGARVINLGQVAARTSLGRISAWVNRVHSALNAAGGNVDVLHGFWVHPVGTVSVAVGAWLRVPVVISVGGGEMVWLPEIGYGGQGTWRSRSAISMTLRRASAVTAGSEYALRPVAAIRPDALRLPLGVDLHTFHGPVERSAGPPWRLLHVAGLNPVKDQTTLLRAMRLVLEKHPHTHLDCVGVDTLGSRMQNLAHDLGIHAAVRFHGFRPLDEIVPMYRAAHLYVQSSLHESMGAAVLEAAASGLPTVGTNLGVLAEMALQAGVAIPVKDPADLAGGIVHLLDHPDRRQSLARAAQAFSETYDADWTAAQLQAVYDRVIRKPGWRGR
jgi:glycosyltransferase involved in cell wall biosynthesis